MSGTKTGPKSPKSVDVRDARCSFCGKHGDRVKSLVLGPTPAVAICDECVEICVEIMKPGRRDVG